MDKSFRLFDVMYKKKKCLNRNYNNLITKRQDAYNIDTLMSLKIQLYCVPMPADLGFST